MLDLSHTAEALRNYDSNPTDATARAVGVAFGSDTAHINDPAVCAEFVGPGKKDPGHPMDLSFVRRLVLKYGTPCEAGVFNACGTTPTWKCDCCGLWLCVKHKEENHA